MASSSSGNTWGETPGLFPLAREKSQDGLLLGVGARCDSMRHCAKVGAYSTVEPGSVKIVYLHLVQVQLHYDNTALRS